MELGDVAVPETSQDDAPDTDNRVKEGLETLERIHLRLQDLVQSNDLAQHSVLDANKKQKHAMEALHRYERELNSQENKYRDQVRKLEVTLRRDPSAYSQFSTKLIFTGRYCGGQA